MGIFLSSRIMKPILALVAVSLVAGCQTLGTGSVTRDRMGYAAAIGDSWKEQMLLNIVKLRYLDTPVYLDVSSVISSYSLASDVGIAANFFPRATEGNNLGLSATGRYSESPTISYIPLTGDRLVKSMLRPIPPETVFATIGGGGRADFILRAVVQAINGIYNVSTSPCGRAGTIRDSSASPRRCAGSRRPGRWACASKRMAKILCPSSCFGVGWTRIRMPTLRW